LFHTLRRYARCLRMSDLNSMTPRDGVLVAFRAPLARGR
jgi:hypothetical protein